MVRRGSPFFGSRSRPGTGRTLPKCPSRLVRADAIVARLDEGRRVCIPGGHDERQRAAMGQCLRSAPCRRPM